MMKKRKKWIGQRKRIKVEPTVPELSPTSKSNNCPAYNDEVLKRKDIEATGEEAIDVNNLVCSW